MKFSDWLLKVKNEDIEDFPRQTSLKLMLLLIILGVFLANPGNTISFALPGVEESLRLGLTPLITMLSGIFMGPIWGGLAGLGIDVFSVVIWHDIAQFIPAFALIVMFRGFFAGYIYKYHFSRFSIRSIFFSVAITYLLTSGIMTPLALYIYYTVPLAESLSQRFTIQALIIPVYTIIAFYILKFRRKTQQIRNMYNEMEKMATTDQLTGLANRRKFTSSLKKYISAACRHNHDLHLIYIDLNNFKRINDTYGHSVGDKVLKKVGNILTDMIRTEDISARLGGDEFVLALFKANAREARQAAKRIRSQLVKLEVEEIEDLNLTTSLGLVAMQEKDTPEDLLARADKAMYKDKKNKQKWCARQDSNL